MRLRKMINTELLKLIYSMSLDATDLFLFFLMITESVGVNHHKKDSER